MRRMKIRSPQVIHETVDGEVVIVNLESGTYYSIVGTGARIWGALERNPTAEEILAEMRATFGSDAGVNEAVEDFIADLERERLIVPTDAETPDDDERPPVEGPPVPDAAREAFEPPVLEKFTDMRELILLDPVHEVDLGKGWPHAKSAG